MFTAFSLALGQLSDPRVLRVLVKSAVITLLLFAVLGTASWWAIDALLRLAGMNEANLTAPDGLRGLAALVIVVAGGWLLWRILALAVLQFHADEVVEAVEARHYPAALATARQVPFAEELRLGMAGAMRAIGFNLLALPIAVVMLATGVGAALVFWAVNAVLLGRELCEMVWLRHRHDPAEAMPLSRGERLGLGGFVSGLLLVPVVNLAAPVVGAAMAAHLVHRKRRSVDANP